MAGLSGRWRRGGAVSRTGLAGGVDAGCVRPAPVTLLQVEIGRSRGHLARRIAGHQLDRVLTRSNRIERLSFGDRNRRVFRFFRYFEAHQASREFLLFSLAIQYPELNSDLHGVLGIG